MLEELRTRIAEKVEPILTTKNYELIELAVQQRMRMIAVCLVIDRYQGNITLDECAEVNRFLTEWIENEAIITGEYTVEVNSPGLDRPLVTVRDFERSLGRQVRFYLATMVDGKKEHAGQIETVDKERIKINTGKQLVEIPVKQINKALPILDW